MKNKPDRFERAVENTLRRYIAHDDILAENRVMKAHDVIKLLRQEHRWMVRMIKKSAQMYRDSDDESPACYLAQDILDRLTRRAL